MEITIKRDGLTLHGDLMKPENIDKCPITIIFHGLMSDRKNIFDILAHELVKRGIAAVKFDFDGHGESDGDFRDMNLFTEILDASKILDYVRSLDWVTEIYIAGHSQGAVVGGMIAGYYSDYIKKLVMLAPAAIIRDDALNGSFFGTKYDPSHVPDDLSLRNIHRKKFNFGSLYFRIAKTMPIYETTAMFKGKALIIHGSADEAAKPYAAKKYTEYMENVKLHMIEGEGHGLSDISLENVICEASDFLAS